MNDYKTIDKQQWACLNKEGDAGSGLIYINPDEPDVILKTSRRAQEASRDNIVKEFYTAKAVYDLGVPTPKVVEIVKIDGQFGIKSQYIKSKVSLPALPERIRIPSIP